MSDGSLIFLMFVALGILLALCVAIILDARDGR